MKGVKFIIIRHELGLDRPVLAPSNSLFKGLPSRLRPFGVKFSIILASCCCSFLLKVVTSLICVFLVPHQLLEIDHVPNEAACYEKYRKSNCG